MKHKKHPYYDGPKRQESMRHSEMIVFWVGLAMIVGVITWGWLNG